MTTDRRLITTEAIFYESLAEGIRLEDLRRAFGPRDREREGEGEREPRHPRPSGDS